MTNVIKKIFLYKTGDYMRRLQLLIKRREGKYGYNNDERAI